MIMIIAAALILLIEKAWYKPNGATMLERRNQVCMIIAMLGIVFWVIMVLIPEGMTIPAWMQRARQQ